MEGFTVAMALVDAIPVLLFGGSMLLIAGMFDSTLFVVGAVMAVVGGLFQVAWKLVLGWKKKSVPILHLLFAPLLSIGGLVMMLGLVLDHGMPASHRAYP